jgi:hypothetical protein
MFDVLIAVSTFVGFIVAPGLNHELFVRLFPGLIKPK